VTWLSASIHVDATRCLAAQSPRSTCRRCQDVCPAHAIRLGEQEVRLDEETCLGCGLCLAACPTGVFAFPGLSWPALLVRLAGKADEGHLTIRCAYATSPAHVTLPCLSLLNSDALLTLAARGVRHLTLRAPACATCPIGADALIEEHLAHAQKRWQGEFHVARESSPERESADLLAVLKDMASPLENPVDRRGFIRLLGARIGSAASDQLAAVLLREQDSPEERPREVPPTRSALLEALGESQDVVSFPHYLIDPACDDCQDAEALCVLFCPTDALRREPTGDGVRFLLRPERCLDCGQCAAVCPKEAIRRGDLEAGRGEKTLRAFQTAQCRRCGQETPLAVDGLCPTCQRRSHLEEMLGQWLIESKARPAAGGGLSSN